MTDPNDIQSRRDAAALRRCLPCPCGGRAEWGAAFLVCSQCGWETGYDDDHGGAVREWNRRANGKVER